MFVTLSFRKYADLIRQLEDLPNETDAELAVRLDYYSKRLWDHLRGNGIDCRGMAEHTPDVAAFQCDISAIGRNWQTGDFDWEKLIGGLQFLNAVAVTVEPIDMEHICTGLIATTMMDNWDRYAHTLQRIPVSQLQAAIENAIREIAWKSPVNVPSPDQQYGFSEDEMFKLQLERAGDASSLELLRKLNQRDAAQEAQRQQEDASAAADQARLERIINGEF